MLTAQLRSYVGDFDRIKRNARALTVGLSYEQFNWRPGADRWSIAECLEHCNIISEKTLPLADQAIRHAREFGPYGDGPFRYGMVSRLFIRSMRPGTMAMPTVNQYRPPPSEYDRDETVNRFVDLQDEWIQAVQSSDGLDLRRIHVPSPAIPALHLSLGAWFEATPLHELRHLEQAQRVMHGEGFPSGQSMSSS